MVESRFFSGFITVSISVLTFKMMFMFHICFYSGTTELREEDWKSQIIFTDSPHLEVLFVIRHLYVLFTVWHLGWNNTPKLNIYFIINSTNDSQHFLANYPTLISQISGDPDIQNREVWIFFLLLKLLIFFHHVIVCYTMLQTVILNDSQPI